jgi:hypothetical protein
LAQADKPDFPKGPTVSARHSLGRIVGFVTNDQHLGLNTNIDTFVQ